MKKGVLAAIILFFLLAVSMGFSQENGIDSNDNIDDEVEEIVDDEGKASVIVVLEDDISVLNEDYSASELNKMNEFDKEKAIIAERQEEVLDNLDLKDESEISILSENDLLLRLKPQVSRRSS